MSIQVAKDELASLTDFQRDIHNTKSITEEIISTFYKSFVKSTWYSSIPAKLKSSEDGDEIIYQVNNSYHFLMYSYIRSVLPAVRVNSKYKGRARIAWCHNVGTNQVVSAVFKEDDNTYQTWDNVWADVYFQFYQDSGAGKRKNHNIGIGNIECIENWNEFLPRYPINVAQPWFYSMDNALAFPIFYKNSQTRAEHRYKMRRKVSQLLRVQILSRKDGWKDTKNIGNYIDIAPDTKLAIPELWGRYAYVTDREIGYHKCQQQKSFYIRDIVICDTSNPNKYETTAEVPLHCTNPCLALFWVAENKDSTENNGYSNYTTNTQDLYKGWDPIRTTSLTYGTTKRLDNMYSDHFSIAEPRKHFPSAPSERGYHAYSYASDSTSYHGDIGIVLGNNMNAKLSCRIANNNIFLDSSDDKDDANKEDDDIVPLSHLPEQTGNIKGEIPPIPTTKQVSKPDPPLDTNNEHSPEFLVRARLLIVRKFTITAQGDPGKETYKFTIE